MELAQPRYQGQQYRDATQTPIADLHMSIVAVQHDLLAQQQHTLQGLERLGTLQQTVNRLNGALSELTQRVELKGKKKND